MAIFDFLKSYEEKKNERKEEIAALEQQIISLRNDVVSEEKKKEEIKSQIVDLKNQVVDWKDELYDLQQDKEKTKKQVDRLQERYEKLHALLTRSTRKLNCMESSDDYLLVDVGSPYLVALDEEDFKELCRYHNLREENSSYYDKKKQREDELHAIEQKIEDANNELNNLREELVKQRDINYVYQKNIIKEQISEYTKELNDIKADISGYLKNHIDKIRLEVIHEIYQRANLCEDEALRNLRETIDGVNIGEIQLALDLKKMLLNVPCKVDSQEWTSSEINLCNLLNEFAQLNIVKIIREMKNSDWDTIKVKIGSLVNIIELRMIGTSYRIDPSYGRNLLNYLEAKYLYIQKQQIEREKEREEREAQREYDRAIKNALKDEEKAQEALEQKKREMAEAQTQEKIQKLQEQIKGLENALVEARELRERAMSMAQQTKIGYVYVISNIGSFGKDIYKIGMTRRLDPMERVMELSNASVPFPFDVHTFIYSEDAPALEADLHRRFDAKKVNSINYRKEYFHVTLDEIKAALKEKGVDANFIDEPDAFQYRESSMRNHDDILSPLQ